MNDEPAEETFEVSDNEEADPVMGLHQEKLSMEAIQSLVKHEADIQNFLNSCCKYISIQCEPMYSLQITKLTNMTYFETNISLL